MPQCQLNHEDPKLKRNVKQYEPDEITFRRIQAQERFFQHQSTDESITTIVKLMKSGKLREKFPEELFNVPRYTLDLWNIRNKLRIRGGCLYI